MPTRAGKSGGRRAFDIALFGWHATIFLGGWVLLLGALCLAVVVALVVKFWLGVRTIEPL